MDSPATFTAHAPNTESNKPKDAKRQRLNEEPEDRFAWFESLRDQHDSVNYLWRNDLLEETSLDASGVSALLELVADDNVEKSTSATIQLARLEPGSRDSELERIARSTSQKKTTKLAAIETLGKSPQADASDRLLRIGTPLLETLLKNHRSSIEPLDDDRYLAMTISMIAERGADLQEFDRCLSSTAPLLSCSTLLELHQKRGATPVSKAGLSCFGHPSPLVRTKLLAWVESARDEAALGEVLKITRGDLNEAYFPAIQTLGAFSTPVSTSRLEELSRDQSPRVRGAALAALIRRDTPTAINAALAETGWQVKKGLAEFIVEPTSEQQWNYLHALLLDPAPAVQQTLLKTVAKWSVEAITKASLIGMQSPMPFVREGHWETLTRARNIDREQFLPFEHSASAEMRESQIAKIREALGVKEIAEQKSTNTSSISLETNRLLIATWQACPEAQRKLVELKLLAIGCELTKVLDSLSPEEIRALPSSFWVNVAAVADPQFAMAAFLRSPDVDERRKAVGKLAEQYNSVAPPVSLLSWLDQLLAPEDDPTVWRRALLVAKKAKDEPSRSAAARIALTALRSETLDVRVTACNILEKSPRNADHVAAIEPLLASESQLERIAAIRAIGRQRELSASAQEKLTSLLTVGAAETRIEAALALARAGNRLGITTLTNAAVQGAESERRLALEKLGETETPGYIPLLIGVLDSGPTLRQAALASLEKLAPEEVISAAEKPFMSSTEAASRWKAWHAARQPEMKMSLR